MLQSVPEVAPVKLLTQVAQAQDHMQQALVCVMEAQAKAQAGKTDSLKYFQCGEPGHFRVQCPVFPYF